MTTPLKLPFPPLVLIESDEPLTWDALLARVRSRIDKGVSICLLTKSGDPNRGGYFFHLRRNGGSVFFSTFDRPDVCQLDAGQDVCLLINHAAGRCYDERMWRLSQRINLRSDA